MEKSNLDGLKAYMMPHPAESFSKPVLMGDGATTIGRDSTNTVQIAHTSVSRKHAKIILENDHYEIMDMDSHNGTLVNGKPIKSLALKHRDKISIGNQGFIFMIASDQSNDFPIDISSNGAGNIMLNDNEIEPSDLYAQMAETASFELFNPTLTDEEFIPDAMRRAHERLALLYKMSEKLRTTDNLEQVLNRGLDLLADAIPAAERSVIMLQAVPSGPFEIMAHKYRTPQENSEAFPISKTIVKWVIAEEMAMVSQNVKDDGRFSDSKSIVIYDLNSIICVPIMIKSKIIGVIYIDSGAKYNPMSQGDLAFAAAVANELALLIENHRLNQINIRNERIAAIGMTITDLAHNIKNLVNINMSAVELMEILFDEMDQKKMKKNWRYIRKGFEQVNQLAVEMLDFAKDNHLDVKSININDLVMSTKDFIEYDLVSDGIELEVELDSKNPVWMMDEKQLQRAIINLIVNSTDALENIEAGKIHIRTQVDENRQLIVSVSDNGCGIETEKIEKIFSLFYTTKGAGGSGLGLPVVKKFVESMGGKIQVDSGKGSGTAVKMVFPEVIDNSRIDEKATFVYSLK